MFVPSRMRDVTAATWARTSSGSRSGVAGLIGGAAAYGYWLAIFVGNTRCSATHTDSKPRSSARRATGTSCSGRSMNSGIPTFASVLTAAPR